MPFKAVFAKRFILTVLTVLFAVSWVFAAPVKIGGAVIETDGKGNATVRINSGLTSKIRVRKLVDEWGNPLEFNSLMPGDRVRSADMAGGVFTVKGFYAAGELHHIHDHKLLTSDGQQIYFSPDAKFFLNGEPVKFDQLKKGFRVFLRIDPETMLAGSVYAVDLRQDRTALDSVDLKIWSIQGPVKNQAFKKGDSLTITVKATAGATCTLDIPGVCYRLPLTEVKEGLYKGDIQFHREDIRQTRFLVRLEKDGKSILRQDPAYFDVAVTSPVIEPVSPVPDASVSGEMPIIFARLSSRGTIIEPKDTQVFLDGVPMNTGLQKNIDYIGAELPASLTSGIHRITVVARDMANNEARATWSFRVR